VHLTTHHGDDRRQCAPRRHTWHIRRSTQAISTRPPNRDRQRTASSYQRRQFEAAAALLQPVYRDERDNLLVADEYARSLFWIDARKMRPSTSTTA